MTRVIGLLKKIARTQLNECWLLFCISIINYAAFAEFITSLNVDEFSSTLTCS